MIRRIHRTVLAAAIGLLAVQPLGAQTAVECAEVCRPNAAIETGSSSFAFTDWAGHELKVWTYVPEGIDRANAPIAIIMHGANRDADRYRDQWKDHAERGGFIVIAPTFAASEFEGSRAYNMGGIFAETGEPRSRELWSFSAIEPLFDDVVARLGGNQTHYTLYGHSAGSQFVHRFLFFMPEARVKRYLAANAGWYTFPDLEIAFPFGLEGTPVGEERLRAALAKDVVLLLGDRDTDPDHSSLNRSRGAMQQGRHRFARGQAFYASAKALAEERGWEFGWSLREVEGVAHSNGGMAEGAWDLIK